MSRQHLHHIIACLSLFILLLWSPSTIAAPIVDDYANDQVDTFQMEKRATVAILSPPAYKLSWVQTSLRASTDVSQGAIEYTYIATSGGLSQTLTNACATRCTLTSQCAMFQIFQVSGSSSGTVVCSLFNQYISSKLATLKSAPKSGQVMRTYAFRGLATPITSTTNSTIVSKMTKPASTSTRAASKSTIKNKKTTSTITIKASTITRPASTATTTFIVTAPFPPTPTGATFMQLAPCSSLTTASVPLFVNDQYNGSSMSTAYIVQHGSGLNFQDYFSAVYNVIGSNGVIVAPNFYNPTSAIAPNTWYQPSINLGWSSGIYSWSIGADAVSPNSVACSSYDVYDALLTYFTNKDLFPNLTNVIFVSHSAGANMVSRYSQIYNGDFDVQIRYIVANPANNAYFTDARAVVSNTTDSMDCPSGFNYPFQLMSESMPRYVANRFTDAATLFQNWISRDVVTLIGTNDTAALYPGGVNDCGSQAQGGVNRRDRNYAWWAYINILAGTGTDVSAYTGYQQLLASGAQTLYQGAFNHQSCSVDGVGHDQNGMFSSNCGVAAMTMTMIPAGVGADYDGGP